ncbi:MAG: tetratricopeptide repeat protein [candidate division Zixibacteria bacterium]
MTRYLLLSILITALSPAFNAQGEGSDPDRKALIKLCRGYLKNARTQMDSGNYDIASAYLDSVFQCDSKNPDAFYYKARILASLGDTTGVIDLLSDGVVKAPRSSRLKLILARYLISRGSPNDAVEHIDNVLAIKPREGEALYLKGQISQARGDTTAAVELYQKALDVSLGKTK